MYTCADTAIHHTCMYTNKRMYTHIHTLFDVKLLCILQSKWDKHHSSTVLVKKSICHSVTISIHTFYWTCLCCIDYYTTLLKSHPIPAFEHSPGFIENERQRGRETRGKRKERDTLGFQNSLLSISACLAVNVITNMTTQEWNGNILAKHSTQTAQVLYFDCTSEVSCRISNCDCDSVCRSALNWKNYQ